ncbi:MAG: hypothetical protein JWM11_7397, partial [Planctomycetaceae bacterium]|nr:hypothetical protein [Planctomycetaceae bacterium]
PIYGMGSYGMGSVYAPNAYVSPYMSQVVSPSAALYSSRVTAAYGSSSSNSWGLGVSSTSANSRVSAAIPSFSQRYSANTSVGVATGYGYSYGSASGTGYRYNPNVGSQDYSTYGVSSYAMSR